ncbi:hypothetical protein N7532_012026 [Penicillium argentinense]|uniref:Uncharacterized protein n=1 Tax=Penicillium argentinense TaxID=1131581 RepID=A0A9W9EJH1_9EURO|nr:uncharacterized protein N7532_012026 [Penicillium argentinense]KAJ5082983.1 hypothetical protein N7532_012026 [Penicillium argentinense]
MDRNRSSKLIQSGPIPDAGISSDFFTIDRKGDRLIPVKGYGAHYNLPKYRRAGQGQVLGADPRYRLHTKDSASEPSKPLFSRRFQQPRRLLRVRTKPACSAAYLKQENDALAQDFLPLDDAAHHGPGTGAEDAGSDDERHAYRSIHGKAKEEDNIPRDMELVSDESDQKDGFSSERKNRQAELSRAVNLNPSDIAAWLRLIDHQEFMVLDPNEEPRLLTYNEQQGVSDVKLSLYDKAIKKSGDSPHKDRLLLGRLQEGAHLWDAEELTNQWKTTLQENSGFISLWIKYLDFRQTDFQHFDFEDCMETFTECLDLNASSFSGTAKSQVQCYIFLRLTLFLREAGYLEMSVGLWQAVLEFTYFKPDSYTEITDKQAALASFRRYWESEVPRIGEDGSPTWRDWIDQPLENNVPIAFHEYKSSIAAAFLMKSWEAAEDERAFASRMPARTFDQLAPSPGPDGKAHYVDDVYSILPFSDLADILGSFWEMGVSEELIDSFLYFCHLPHLTRCTNLRTTRLWAGDSFIRNELLDYSVPGLHDRAPQGPEAEERYQRFSPFSFPMSDFLPTSSTLFPSPSAWFDSFLSWRQQYIPHASSLIDRKWVQMTLRRLVERGRPQEAFDDDLAEYTLGLMFVWDPKKAKQYAKSLLKKWTSSLRVCNALALMELRSGSPAAAVRVWSSSITWSKTRPLEIRINSGILWSSWAWELVHQGSISHAAYVLHAIPAQGIDQDTYDSVNPANVAPQPTTTLQVQSYLRECQSEALACENPHAFVAYTTCFALLLLVEQCPMQTTLEVFSEALQKSNTLFYANEKLKVYTSELLHQARVGLLGFKSELLDTKLPPKEIRQILQESISLFPNNTMFLSVFTRNESSFNMLDRIRDIRSLTRDPENRYKLDHSLGWSAAAAQGVPITTHLLPIWRELSRPDWAGATRHSTRAAFEKALGDIVHASQKPIGNLNPRGFDTARARSNLAVWKLYIMFEISGARDIEAAKAVFYRAIRACPWSKQLFMLGFRYLQHDTIQADPSLSETLLQKKPKKPKPTGLSFDELRVLYSTMIAKQLRIHVDISEEIRDIVSKPTE